MDFETFDMKKDKRGAYTSPVGSPTLDIYEYKVSKAGYRELVKTDRKEDVHARIQADADACDINKLMARFALGDSTALDQRPAFYADATKLPNNYADLFDRLEHCKEFFNSLPADLKQLFDNSYEVYFANFGNEDFNKKYAEYNKRFENHQFEVQSSAPEDIKTSEFVEVDR